MNGFIFQVGRDIEHNPLGGWNFTFVLSIRPYRPQSPPSFFWSLTYKEIYFLFQFLALFVTVYRYLFVFRFVGLLSVCL